MDRKEYILKLLSFEVERRRTWGTSRGDWVIDIRSAIESLPNSNNEHLLAANFLQDLLVLGNSALEKVREIEERAISHITSVSDFRHTKDRFAFSLEEIRLLAPIPKPGKIIGLARNYAEHAGEIGRDVPTSPIAFGVFANAVVGPEDPIYLHEETTSVDYEGELAAIIGDYCRDVPRETALGYVAGYSIMNDVSARDLQRNEGQWLRAKGADSFKPFGPWIVTTDEIPNPQILDLKVWVNDELRQDANTSGMVFPLDLIISHISSMIGLDPGDVISTGTPAGIGMARKPPEFLKAGDEVRIEIDHIGILTNHVEGPTTQDVPTASTSRREV